MKIGVYVCECGNNIASTVDVQEVSDYVSKLPKVAVARDYKYMCSEPGRALIREDIEEFGLDRVVVASCSPRLHEPTFMEVVEEAGLNPYCFEMANIREQCSWVHDDVDEATEKAKDLVRSAVYKAACLEPLKKISVDVIPQALVIGGGISGIQTALDIADHGFKTYLVERTPSIGGHMAQLDKTFPTLDCSACILTPKMVDVQRHPNIELLTYSEVAEIDGYIGNFKVRVRKKPRYVDIEKCTGCGDCADVCPVEEPNEFDVGLGERKAIYVPFPQAVPLKYTIEKRGKSPCNDACPAGANPHGYCALISQRKFKEALDLVREGLPFPSICGRVCHRPCEDECNRQEADDPIALRPLKRFIADRAREGGEEKPKPITPEKEDEVAIVGAGPAGLTCGLRLLEMGYPVTIIDASPEPGGLMTSCIPGYRLPKEIAEYDIDRLLTRGLDVKTDTKVGEDITLDEIREDYNATFIAIGAQDSVELNIDGAGMDGVLYGMSFLKEAKNRKAHENLGSRVVVIGGGNVAIDCSRVASRLGAEDVKLLYRRTREQMPAYDWEVEEAEDEGVDIHYLVSPSKILGEDGEVTGIELIRNELGEPDESGRKRPIPVEGSEFVMDTDTVILAIGQKTDLTGFEDIGHTSWGTIEADELTLQTDVPDVFAGGDVVRGPASIVEAVEDGDEAAISIDRYLKGKNLREGKTPEVEVAELPEEGVEYRERNEPPKKDPKQRTRNFEEVEICFDEETAVEEAKRCLNCGGCSECMECLEACEDLDAINHDMEDEIVNLDVGAIVVATGFDTFDPGGKPEYGYDGENVITGLEFERIVNASGPTDGRIEINGKEPERVVFISCVGSRDEEVHEYCSRVCCMYTAKHAHLVREKIPDAEITVYYTDMRAFGKGYEQFYNRVQEEGVEYRKRDLDDEIEVISDGEGTKVLAEGYEDMEADLVVLATAIEPREDAEEVARLVNINRSDDGFFMEAHPKLRPLDTPSAGIFLAGMCQGPKDIPDAVSQASGAAAKACDILSKRSLETEATTATVIEDNCRGCGSCVEACPYDAIELKEVDEEGIYVAEVNEAICEGCGVCAATCLNSAIQHRGFTDTQILRMIEALGVA